MKKIKVFFLLINFIALFTIMIYPHNQRRLSDRTKSSRNSPKGRGIVRGKVVSHHHKPLANVHVQLKHETHSEYPLMLSAVTNKDGRWSIAGVGNVKWMMEVTFPGYTKARHAIWTKNASEDIPLIRTVLRRIVDEEEMGLADIDYLSFDSREKVARAIAADKSEEIESFITNNDKRLERFFYIALGNGYFDNEQYSKAMKHYSRAGFKRGANRIGDMYMDQENLDTALEYYQQGISSEKRAFAYGLKAKYFLKNKNQQERKKYLRLAYEDYNTIIKNCTFSWKKAANENRRHIMRELNAYPKTQLEIARDRKLAGLLKGVARYCRLLEDSSIYFYCYEEVVEKSNIPKEELYPDSSKLIAESMLKGWQKRTHRFIYDYQLLKEGSALKEQRNLVKMNGRRRKKKNARLTTIYQISRNISGPIGLISRAWQDHTDYRLVTEKKIGNDNISVVQCFPKSFREKNHLFGDVWIRNRDFRVIKIVWYPYSIGNRTAIEDLARFFKRTPRITFISEYGVAKSGIQFPSKCLVQEEYLSAGGDVFTRIQDTYEYKNYHFFKIKSFPFM